MKFKPEDKPETTLVIIKPDAFKRRSARPGNIIDIFSKTGLYIVGTKLLRLSVAQAEEFYGPLKEMFVKRLKGNVETPAHRAASRATFGFTHHARAVLRDGRYPQGGQRQVRVRPHRGVHERAQRPHDQPVPRSAASPARPRRLALLYRGTDAINKIRERLGSTDPTKAAEGTVRSDFGFDLMKNGAHASDSVENAERERKIIGLWPDHDTPDVDEIIREYLKANPAERTTRPAVFAGVTALAQGVFRCR